MKQEIHVHSKVVTPGADFFREVADHKSLEDAKVCTSQKLFAAHHKMTFMMFATNDAAILEEH